MLHAHAIHRMNSAATSSVLLKELNFSFDERSRTTSRHSTLTFGARFSTYVYVTTSIILDHNKYNEAKRTIAEMDLTGERSLAYV
jgi:hypothetical protein